MYLFYLIGTQLGAVAVVSSVISHLQGFLPQSQDMQISSSQLARFSLTVKYCIYSSIVITLILNSESTTPLSIMQTYQSIDSLQYLTVLFPIH